MVLLCVFMEVGLELVFYRLSFVEDDVCEILLHICEKVSMSLWALLVSHHFLNICIAISPVLFPLHV